jgi:hypothetical protein
MAFCDRGGGCYAADVDPVGGLVAGAAEAIRLHKDSQERGAVAVALLPIIR